jgi:hypothetical protein
MTFDHKGRDIVDALTRLDPPGPTPEMAFQVRFVIPVRSVESHDWRRAQSAAV